MLKVTVSSTIAQPADPYPHPTLAPESAWPGVVVIVIMLGLIGTAAVLGPIVRAINQDDLPAEHDGDDVVRTLPRRKP